jgi:hypothetical protein
MPGYSCRPACRDGPLPVSSCEASLHHLHPQLFSCLPSALTPKRRRQIGHAAQRVGMVRSQLLLLLLLLARLHHLHLQGPTRPSETKSACHNQTCQYLVMRPICEYCKIFRKHERLNRPTLTTGYQRHGRQPWSHIRNERFGGNQHSQQMSPCCTLPSFLE